MDEHMNKQQHTHTARETNQIDNKMCVLKH